MKRISLYIMAVFYVGAGVNHFIHPGGYIQIMPTWLPLKSELVFISGVCEALFGLLLLPLTTRRVAAWAIIALLIAVFPANVQMMLDYYKEHNPLLWIAVVRLPLQILLVWWAYTFTKPENNN